MTPAARIAAAIEPTGEIDRLDEPADRVVGRYWRRRRYIGAKDRRAISDLVYGALRRRGRLEWWIGRCADLAPDARARLLVYLMTEAGWRLEDVVTACDGHPYHPAPLQPAEQRMLVDLGRKGDDESAVPAAAALEMPDWLLPAFDRAFGPRSNEELVALTKPASLDLRVNRLKASRERARAALEGESIESLPTPLSPLGLRVERRHNLGAVDAFRRGMVEVQDEGAQLVALLCGARPGMRVADLCAGGGGKTLCLAAEMGNRGQILAVDVDGKRLSQMRARLKRAGVTCVEARVLAREAEIESALPSGCFDRVLADVPCSGSGTWRRQPEQRWRLTPERLQVLLAMQGEILHRASRLVAPGGRLAYATCSLLPEENSDVVERFLSQATDFHLLPMNAVWAENLDGPCPATGESLQLTPASNGTDGFFVAVLERAP